MSGEINEITGSERMPSWIEREAYSRAHPTPIVKEKVEKIMHSMKQWELGMSQNDMMRVGEK